MSINKFMDSCAELHNQKEIGEVVLYFLMNIGLAKLGYSILDQSLLLGTTIVSLMIAPIPARIVPKIIENKDIKKVLVLYKEFLKNYDKLNRTFKLDNPVEIYAMFNYLYTNGYLSKNKTFEATEKEAVDVRKLFGTEVIKGKGVCRHLSAMLKDILNEHGINASQISVCQNKLLEILDAESLSKLDDSDLLDYYATNIRDQELFDQFLTIYEAFKEGKELDRNSLKKLLEKQKFHNKINFNHAITFAEDNDNVYFLDPMQSRTYRYDESRKNVVVDSYCECQMKLNLSIATNRHRNIMKMKRSIANKKPTISKEKETELIEKTNKICQDNTDIFEKFYKDNRELYSDISNQLSRVRNI